MRLPRLALIGLLVVPLAARCEDEAPLVEPEREWELWPRRDAFPPESESEFLNFLTPSWDDGIFEYCHSYRGQVIPLNLQHDGVLWKGLQMWCDGRLAETVGVNRWIIGLLVDGWPHNTVNVEAELTAMRLVAIEIDGERVPVTTDDILTFTTDNENGIWDWAGYVILPRFKTTGIHSLKYIWRQEAYFFFHFDQELHDRIFGGAWPDPYPEFEGRRVFVPEVLGDPVDGYITLSYTLRVVDED